MVCVFPDAAAAAIDIFTVNKWGRREGWRRVEEGIHFRVERGHPTLED
jgi:hypothetical protein